MLLKPIDQPRLWLGTNSDSLALMVRLLYHAQKNILKVLSFAPKLADRDIPASQY
jgi:hypothetical protein